MRPLTKLERTGLVAAVVVGGCWFYLNRVVAPLEREAQRLRKDLATEQQALAKLAEPQEQDRQRLERALARQRGPAEAARAALAQAGAALPGPERAGAAIAAITEAAAAAGLQVATQSLGQGGASPVLPEALRQHPWTGLSLVLRGPYPGVARWLDRLASLPHPVLVEDLRMVRGPDGLVTTVRLRL